MNLNQRLARLESRTASHTDELTTIRRVIIERDADGVLRVLGWRERDLRTGDVRTSTTQPGASNP